MTVDSTSEHGEHDGLQIVTFADVAQLRDWLSRNHAEHPGVWVRLYKKSSGRPSVGFNDLLEEGLCFGWSESTRHAGDADSYLQRFTPRRSKGTKSERNRRLFDRLSQEGRMTDAGRQALGFG